MFVLLERIVLEGLWAKGISVSVWDASRTIDSEVLAIFFSLFTSLSLNGKTPCGASLVIMLRM